MPTGPQVRFETEGAIAVITVDNPPVNALGQDVRAGLVECLARAEADDAIHAIVLLGAGRHFIAGADIREFGKPLLAPTLPDVCHQIEMSRCLVVASLHGACLGGGLEIALSAHFRTAEAKVRLGLPEVNLGLIPGAGGTQRLPRLTGTDAALELITSGKQIAAPEALRFGMLDAVHEGDARAEGLKFARELLAQGATPRRTRDVPPSVPIDWGAQSEKLIEKSRGKLAPLAALKALKASTELTFDAGIAEERRIFCQLLESDQREALVHVFFAERAAAKLPELEGVAALPVQQIGVVGGGTMGTGIATSVLLAGLPVTLVETNAEAAKTALDRILSNLDGALGRGKLSQTAYQTAASDNLRVGTALSALAEADVVIEAVFEDIHLKQDLFAALDKVCKEGAILATNTSYLDVNAIAEVTTRPERVIGLHFFSPAHIMKLLEVVVPERAVPEVVATGFDVARRLGKCAVPSGVGEGFIGNRILIACRAAADWMVLAGASPQEVDRALEGYGFAMGPFAVADLAGLDIGRVSRARLRACDDLRGSIADFPDKLCDLGHLGRKAGRGYYQYDDTTGHRRANQHALDLIDRERAERGITLRAFSGDQIVARYLAVMVNAACNVLEEGVARRSYVVDLVEIAGYGFPRYLGGPCKWADQKGLPALLSELNEYAKDVPSLWQPSPLLERLAQTGQRFVDFDAERQSISA